MKRLALILCLLTAPVYAVQPDEILPDPELEARARDISSGIRCPVCQGETIDDSNASVARDLRLVIRERLVAGDSDEDVIAFVVARYGEFVLFEPPARGANLLLWLAGPVMLIAALAIVGAALRRRDGNAAASQDQLSADEQAALDAILRK